MSLIEQAQTIRNETGDKQNTAERVGKLFEEIANVVEDISDGTVNGQLYMNDNATATTVLATETFYKVAGTSSASPDNRLFSVTDGRLTCNAVKTRKYLIQATLSFNSGNNNVCEFGFYDSTISGIRVPSRIKTTANAAGRAENVTIFCFTTLPPDAYVEVHCANTSDTNDITVTDLNFAAFAI